MQIVQDLLAATPSTSKAAMEVQTLDIQAESSVYEMESDNDPPVSRQHASVQVYPLTKSKGTIL